MRALRFGALAALAVVSALLLPSARTSAATCQSSGSTANSAGTFTVCADAHTNSTTVSPDASITDCYAGTCTTVVAIRVPQSGVASLAPSISPSVRPGTVGPIPNVCIGVQTCTPQFVPVYGATVRITKGAMLAAVRIFGIPVDLYAPLQICASTFDDCPSTGYGIGGLVRVDPR